jgi:hypothetical protein
MPPLLYGRLASKFVSNLVSNLIIMGSMRVVKSFLPGNKQEKNIRWAKDYEL